jgi:FHA domain
MTLYLAVFEGRDSRQVFRLDEDTTFLLGRGQDADVPLQDRSVSRRHCLAEVAGDRLVLRDVGSRNGTWVNGQRVGFDPRQAATGSVVGLGGVRILILDNPGITEDRWLNCREATLLLGYVPARRSRRKLRLLACALGRQLWSMLPENGAGRHLVETVERYADGDAGTEELQTVHERAVATRLHLRGLEQRATGAVLHLGNSCPREAVQQTLLSLLQFLPPDPPLCDVIRDILGEFFLRPALPEDCRSWNDHTVERMARTIYTEHAFEDLPVLADALEDAGCEDQVILDHCRSGLTHARGCWLLDSLLGQRTCRAGEQLSVTHPPG